MIEAIPTWLVVCALGLLGATFGSFAGAQVWRLRARQLIEDKSAGEEYDRVELRALKPLATVSTKDDRSRCLHCGHVLAWYDLLPVVSWVSTAGRCRYCKKRIGWFELVIELGLGVFFAVSYLVWPLSLETAFDVALLAVWLAASVPLAILFAYDAKWFLLPDVPMVAFLLLATVFAGLTIFADGVSIASLLSLLGAITAIGGLYWVLHAISRGQWVGYGDVTLGVGLGLLLGRWEIAVVAVVLANLVGTLLVLPGMVRGTLARGSHMPFGPLLITGMVLAQFWGENIVNWYLGFL